jgi:hypothetical protein
VATWLRSQCQCCLHHRCDPAFLRGQLATRPRTVRIRQPWYLTSCVMVVSTCNRVRTGEQKSGSTWLWELLNAHPCLISAAQPHYAMGAITTKETYYFTSSKIVSDARQFLVPWMGYRKGEALRDRVWENIEERWFEHVLQVANATGTASDSTQYFSKRSYVSPGAKLSMKPCSKHYLLEGTNHVDNGPLKPKHSFDCCILMRTLWRSFPLNKRIGKCVESVKCRMVPCHCVVCAATPHNLHTPVAAKRIKTLFPDARIMAILKEPAWRMRSAYNQFGSAFTAACPPGSPADWCPVYRYYQLRLPTFEEVVKQELEYLRRVGEFHETNPVCMVAVVPSFRRSRRYPLSFVSYCTSWRRRIHRCTGCTFEDVNQTRTWTECFGCSLMDPWRHRTANINIERPPYAPSAALSMYAAMLREWRIFFPLEDMRVMNYQDLVDDPFTVVNALLRYLGTNLAL